MHSKCTLRPYRVSDMLLINVTKEQPEFYLRAKDRLEFALYIENAHKPVTIECDDGTICFIAGAYPYTDKAAEGFFIIGDKFIENFNKTPLLIIKTMLYYIKNSPFDRIQTLVYSDFKKAKKLVELLGLTKEGTLRKGSLDNKDVDMYAWIRGSK